MPEILGVSFDDPVTMVNNMLAGVTSTITGAKNAVVGWIEDVFGGIGGKVKDFFSDAFGWVKNLVLGAFRALFNGFKFW